MWGADDRALAEPSAASEGPTLAAPREMSRILPLMWVLAAAALGYGVTAVFVGGMQLQRRVFLFPYVLTVTALAWSFLRFNRIRLSTLLARHWKSGLAGAALLGAVSGLRILAEPATAHATGWRLGVDLVWSGVVYGIADAVLLTVLPVLALAKACKGRSWASGRRGRILVRSLGLLASVLVTLAYHAGYPEYQGYALAGAAFGNALMTIGYVLTGSPLTPVGGHVLLHLAAVLHGPASTSVLPPHY